VMSKIVAGLFRTQADCDSAAAELSAAGIASADMAILGRADAAMDGFVRRLATLGIPDEDAGAYKEGIRTGYALLTVRTTEEKSSRVADILLRHHPIGMKHGISGTVQAPTPTAPARSAFEAMKADFVASEEIKVPIMAERLEVGKRVVERGGLRIYNRIVEKPVEASVNLREEHVKVERRPMDKPVSDAVWEQFRAEDFEIMEHGEEAVAKKSARVVEELVVERQVGEHEETIRGTVRSTELKVERTPPPPRAVAKTENGGAAAKASLKPRATADGKLAVPVVEEALRFEKRQVDRGAVHITERVVEKPAEAKVMLRDEKVRVSRRTLDQPVAGAEWDSVQESIEMTERSEEPVIGKSSHIVEEVLIKKVVDPREEVVRDTLRKTEVRVEPFNQREFAAFEKDFRADYDKNYARTSFKYPALAAAYRFGFERGRHSRFAGKDWAASEVDLGREWARENPDGAWDQFKAPVRFGFEKSRFTS